MLPMWGTECPDCERILKMQNDEVGLCPHCSESYFVQDGKVARITRQTPSAKGFRREARTDCATSIHESTRDATLAGRSDAEDLKQPQPCNNCGQLTDLGSRCGTCSELEAEVLSLRRQLAEFDDNRIAKFKSILAQRRLERGVKDAGRAALSVAAGLIWPTFAIRMAEATGLGGEAYGAKGILAEADYDYFARYMNLMQRLTAARDELGARWRRYRDDLAKAQELLANEQRRKEELERARRLLDPEAP